MTIEELAKRLVILANKTTLSKAEHEETRKAMCQLKKEGMSNEEIARLSDGKWTVSTVKGYTKGIKAADPNPWQDVATLLNNLISSNMTLDDVETAVTLHYDLEEQGVTLEQVIDLLLTVDPDSVDLATVIQHTKELAESGLTPKGVAEAVGLKKELEDEGFSLDSLPVLTKLAQNYGDAQKVLEAVSAYGSIGELQNEISSAKKELQDLSAEKAYIHKQLAETQTMLSELAKPLQAYHSAVDLGFGEEELADLAALAEKYGGPKAVLQALKAYGNYGGITDRISKAKAHLDSLKTEINKLDAKHNHLKSAIAMCDSLIHDHKLGLDAIATLLSIAKKYGEPASVLKAVQMYGNAKAMTQKLTELEAKVQETEKLSNQLEGQHKASLKHLESLSAITLKVGADVAKLESRLANSKELEKVFSLINAPASTGYNEGGPLVVALVNAIYKWVSINEKHFRYPHSIKSTLHDLLKELGGE